MVMLNEMKIMFAERKYLSRYKFLLLKNNALTPSKTQISLSTTSTDLSGSLNSYNTCTVEHKHISSFFSLQHKAIRDFKRFSGHM